ncbi:MAG: hypothetical protein HY455_00530 [Parcubacteria group bacterium]|nr:hypothetical protein [Parcubacteria group bacterium]
MPPQENTTPQQKADGTEMPPQKPETQEKEGFFVFGGASEAAPNRSLSNEVGEIWNGTTEKKEDITKYGVQPMAIDEDAETLPITPSELEVGKQIPVPKEETVESRAPESIPLSNIPTIPQKTNSVEKTELVAPSKIQEKPVVENPSIASFLKPLRTFKTDVTETIQREKRSITGIALAEHAKRETLGVDATNRERRFPLQQLLLVGLGVILIAGTLGLGFYIFTQQQEEQVELEVAQNETLFTEEVADVVLTSLSRSHIESQIRKRVNEVKLTINDMLRIRLVRETPSPASSAGTTVSAISAQELFLSISPDMPSALTRTLGSIYVLGFHALSQNHPFLILKVSSYDQAFGGMLEWEPAMLQGLTPLLLGTAPRGLSRDARFEDVIVKNQDARMLRDASNQILLLYSFIDGETLLIATNEVTFDEAVKRLKQPERVTR